MGLKQCDKCSEMVEEAKAFCPGCGRAFVEEEKRQASSGFDTMDSTVQLGQTMYNQMLSDMGLNISKSPQPSEKRVEVLEPIAPAVKQPEPIKIKPASKTKWFILAAMIVVLGFLLILAAAALIVIFWPRLT